MRKKSQSDSFRSVVSAFFLQNLSHVSFWHRIGCTSKLQRSSQTIQLYLTALDYRLKDRFAGNGRAFRLFDRKTSKFESYCYCSKEV